MADTAVPEASAKSEAKEEHAPSTDSANKESVNVDGGKSGETAANTTAQDEEVKPEVENKSEDTEDKAVNDKAEEASNYKNGTSSGRRDDYSRTRGSYRGRSSRAKEYGNKFDPSSAKETDDPVEIRKQVEFYFSDSNLPNDKFLFESIGGSENKPVQIKTIHNFKRMRRFQPFSAIVAALKDSTTLNVVEDDTAIQRKTPLPEGTGSTQPEIQKVFEDQAMSRSIYVKGFGTEEPSSQFDIEAWFDDFGATNQVRLRRTTDHSFKGSVFVEFDSEETAKKFLALDPAPKYNGRKLMIKSKKQYCDEKVDEINSGAKRVEEPDADDWKARREYDRKRGFPSNKDGRDGRNGRGRGGRGGGRGRGSNRHHNTRSNDTRARREEDEDREDEDKKDEDRKDEDQAPAVQQSEASTEDKKRSREDEYDGETPAAKKAAIEQTSAGS